MKDPQRWRRLFGLVPSRPGHPFGARELLGGLLAYATVLAVVGAAFSAAKFDDPWGIAVGLFALFALILLVRFAVERRGVR